MPDHRQSGNGRRGGSLLSQGRVERRGKTVGGGSLLGAGVSEPNPALQHRLARSRREARPNPLLHALATKPDPDKQAEAEIGAEFANDLESDFDGSQTVRDRNARRTREDGRSAKDDFNAANDDRHGTRRYDENGSDPYRPLIDPVTVIDSIRRSKRLIAAMTIAGALAGVLIAFATPKQYESFAELLVDPRNIRIVDRELVNSDVSPNTAIAIVENQMRIMTSSTVVNKVVDRLNLDTDPEFNGASTGFRIPNLIGELRSLLARRDDSSGTGRTHAIAVQALLESLEVERSGRTFVVTVGVKTQNAEKSALIANTVVDVFLENSTASLSSTAVRAASELGGKLDELRRSVEEAERKVETFKGERDLIDARGRLIGDDEIIKINDQLATARARTIELSARAASARSVDVNVVIGGALPEGVNSTLVTELRSQYAELLRQASQSAVKYGSKHPQSRAIQAQIDGARQQLQTELRRIAASMQVELKRAVELEQKLSARLAALKARQVNVSDDMVTLRELERDAAAKRAVYESYLLRARETGEQKDLNQANMSLISPAAAPLDPVGPSRSMIAIAGTLAGFLLGVGIGGARGAAQSLFGGNPPAPPPGRQYPDSPRSPRDRHREPGRNREENRFRTDSYPENRDEQLPAAEDRRTSDAGAAPAPAPPPGAWPQTAYAAPHGHPAYPPYPAPPAYPAPGMVAYGPYPMPVPFNPVAMVSPAPYPPPVYAGMPFPAYGQPAHPQNGPAATGNESLAGTAPEAAKPARKQKADRSRPADDVERIRDDLREMRGAIYDLAERRSRRRA
ncbi:MAG: GumC family protein [Rhizobiaceae bacterium]